MAQTDDPHVVIIGAGFGGLWAARALAHPPFNVTLIDRNNYHTFLPLLYQVAAAELEPEEIIYPVRSILRPLPNVGFLMAEVRCRWWLPSRCSKPQPPPTISAGNLQGNLLCPSDSAIRG